MFYEVCDLVEKKLKAAPLVDIHADFVNHRVDVKHRSEYVPTFTVRLLGADTPLYNPLASFTLSGFPGNANIVVFNDAYVRRAYRRLGLGTALHSVRLECCRQAGISLVVATVSCDNEGQLKIMQSFDWLATSKVDNVWLFTKDLSK